MVGIIGMKTVTRSGSMAEKYMPPIYILLEDDLAMSVINCLYSGENLPKKYIFSGVWRNQASCLYGFLTYSAEIEALKIPSFGIVAISDGDISEGEIQSSVSKAIQGDYKNPEQEKIAEKIANSTTCFNLSLRPTVLKGHPEYNHKKWLEEITPEMVSKANSEVQHGFITETTQLSSLFELIEFSKSITDSHPKIKIEKSKPDYHRYYDIIKEDFKASNSDHKMNQLHWYILSCIKHYNPEKWNFYTKDVRENIDAIYQEHRQRFIDSHFDFRT
jgi:hypothetical protein